MASDLTHGNVHYAGQLYTLPLRALEEIEDIIDGLDRLGGSHLYRIGGGGDDTQIALWIAPGVPIVLQYPNGYVTPDDHEDYVERRLLIRARHQLGLPLDGSGDNAG
ncbi:hypothetical protein [Gordonia alkanivorans]|uniref:Uncharacterized protein n=1 Tax=Gordonia alkanivorans NBRC 16433 TaxID=1027371 RepID=F9VVD9_9ACTN|nr:hypothetical protein [Gordonia alkanivorans]GAA12568.1 hypothetical protein GOALK_056_00010 [Gordonia alkanivorans NBRC 16433]